MSSELGLRMFDPIDGSTQVKTIDQALVKQVFQRNTMVKLQNHDNCLDNSCSDIVSGHSMASKSEKGDTDASTQSESSSTKSALTTTTDSTDNELQRIRQFDLTFIPEQKFVPIIPSQLEVLQYEKDIQSKTLAELENSTVEQLLKPFSQSNDITLEENSKDVFIADFIKVVLKYEIDLDFAIVCTNATSEKAIISALDFWGFCQNRVRFAPLGRVVRQSLEDRRFYGVIMKIRKSGKRASYVRKLEVDFIIVSDSAALRGGFESELDMVFEGITYNPPQKVYLSAMFTPDMRCYLLNQAQQIKNRKTLWHTQYRRMTNGARAFIFHLPNYHPRSSNECWRWSRWVAADLADWAQEFINIPYKFNFPTQDSFICRLLQKEAEESPDDCLKLPRNITKKIHLEELRAFKRRMLREKEERERRVEEQERLRKKTELEQKKRAQQVLEEERKRIDAEIQRKKREEAKEKQQMLNRMEQAERQRKQAEVLRQSKKGEQHSQKIMAHKQDEAKQKQQQCLVRELQIRTPPGTQSASSTNSRSSPTPPVSTSSNFNIASHLTAAANPECRRTLSPSRSSNGGSSKKFITSLKKPTMENHQQADVSNKQPIELSKNVSNASIVTPAIAAEARSGFNASPSSSLDISQQQVISASAISTVNSSSSSDTDRPSTHTSKEQQAAAVKPIQNVTSHSQSAKGTFSKDMNDVSTVYTEYNTIFKRKASPTDSPKTKILKTSMSSSKNSNVLTTESPEHQQQQISFNQIVSEAFDTSFLHTELSNILEDLETL